MQVASLRIVSLWLTILGNKEILGKSQIWVETESSSHTSSQNLKFGNSSEKNAKKDLKALQSCPLLLDFFIFFQIFCPRLQLFSQLAQYISKSSVVYKDIKKHFFWKMQKSLPKATGPVFFPFLRLTIIIVESFAKRLMTKSR